MSTRSNIGILKENGNVKYIYCHWDGYPSYNGAMLTEYYNDKDKVEKLINLGSISSLREECDIPAGESHSFDHPLDNVTVAHHRDRGEELEIEEVRLDDYYSPDGFIEYCYLFANGKWYCFDTYEKKFIDLYED